MKPFTQDTIISQMRSHVPCAFLDSLASISIQAFCGDRWMRCMGTLPSASTFCSNWNTDDNYQKSIGTKMNLYNINADIGFFGTAGFFRLVFLPFNWMTVILYEWTRAVVSEYRTARMYLQHGDITFPDGHDSRQFQFRMMTGKDNKMALHTGMRQKMFDL